MSGRHKTPTENILNLILKELRILNRAMNNYHICECGEKLLICDSGMRLCSVGCKDKWVNSKGEILQDKTDE